MLLLTAKCGLPPPDSRKIASSKLVLPAYWAEVRYFQLAKGAEVLDRQAREHYPTLSCLPP